MDDVIRASPWYLGYLLHITRLLCLLLTPPVLPLSCIFVQSIEKMYHGLVAHMLVINSPSAVKAMYRIVRPILPAYIQERVCSTLLLFIDMHLAEVRELRNSGSLQVCSTLSKPCPAGQLTDPLFERRDRAAALDRCIRAAHRLWRYQHVRGLLAYIILADCCFQEWSAMLSK